MTEPEKFVTGPEKPRTTRETRDPEARAARRERVGDDPRVVDVRSRARRKPSSRLVRRKRVLDPTFMIDPPREPGPHRPWSVTFGGLCAYILAALFLSRGVQNPSDSSGTGGNGIAFIILGTLLLALATFSLQGRPVARACLVIPLVVGSLVVLRDDTQPWWLRAGSAVLTVVIVALFLLEPQARRFFGDDNTKLHLTKSGGGE